MRNFGQWFLRTVIAQSWRQSSPVTKENSGSESITAAPFIYCRPGGKQADMDVGWLPSAAWGFTQEADAPATPEFFSGLVSTRGGEAGSQLQAHLGPQPLLPRWVPESLGFMIVFRCGDRGPAQGRSALR